MPAGDDVARTYRDIMRGMLTPFPTNPNGPSALCYALGYLTGAGAFWAMARRRRLATQGIAILMGAGLVGGLIGANAVQQLIAREPGKTVLGGIVFGWLSVILAKRYLGIKRSTGDLFAVAVSAGEAVGRLGCFFGGCCYGKACDLPWSVWQHDAHRHPTQIYLSVANAAILAVLLRIDRAAPPENTLFYVQGVLYCAARFAVEFFRDVRPAAMGLTAAQWGCAAGLAFFLTRLILLMRATKPDVARAS
jgi:phosphatidylglycerol:prolipoprotein diacylglycerol transferase